MRAAALAVPGVCTIEKCRIRKSGIALFVEVHVHVAPDMPVYQGHALAHHVKAALMAHKAQIQDVTVHIEPATIPPNGAPA